MEQKELELKYQEYENLNLIERFKKIKKNIAEISSGKDSVLKQIIKVLTFSTICEEKNSKFELSQKEYLTLYPLLLNIYPHPKELFSIKKEYICLTKSIIITIIEDFRKIYKLLSDEIKQKALDIYIIVCSSMKKQKQKQMNLLKELV